MKLFFLIFKGPAAPHQIRLLKSNHHFHGCTSFPAFVNLSYYCLDCERGFNTNDRRNHTCQGNRCSACGRFDFRDYVRGTRPTDDCTLCHYKSYSVYCKRHHVVTKQSQSVKTCLKCQAQYTVVPNQRHKCGYAKCPVCDEWVFINDHKCDIQPVVEEERDTKEPTEELEGEGRMVGHPLHCSFMRISKPCRMPRVFLWPICCAVRRRKKRPSMYWKAMIVPYNFYTIWMI